MNYQGMLTDSDGNPLTGQYNITFYLFTASSGGTAIWSENHPLVQATDGVYNVQLGGLTPDLFEYNELYLEVEVAGETLQPRQQLTSSAFSMKAAKAEDADTLDGMDSTAFSESVHAHSFGEITGTASDAQIPNNITINYATTAGDANTVDGEDASAFADAVHTHGFSQITGSASDAQIPNNITINYAASAGDANTLDGLDSSSFLNTSNDYGRSGVASNLYEGTTAIVNKYVNQSGDAMLSSSTGSVLGITNTGTGMALDAEAENGSIAIRGLATATGTGVTYGGYFEAYKESSRAVAGATNGNSARGVYGYATGTNGVGVYGEATGADSWAGYFAGRLNVEGAIHIPNNTNINNATGNAILHTGWSSQFGDYTDIKSGYAWGSGEPVAVVAGTYGVFFTKGDESGNPHAETLMRVNTNGRLTISELEITGGSDLSEQFDIRGPKEGLVPSPGMVVSIDPTKPGDLVISQESYDRRVAGVISGAGGVKPGMLMGQKNSEADGANPVALTGRVYCRADASNGPIMPGDLLTTSDTPGHAMKATDYAKAQGAILGKAMTGLESGKGLVLVLVTLQ
jgi:hypothetical protein